jgi:hypothetical protein
MGENNFSIEYLKEALKFDQFVLVIVGQDPYPKGANGIAFCKTTFDEFFDSYCCGKEVLYSLGYTEQFIKKNYASPIALFYDLLHKGIAFINVSSVLLKDKTIKTSKEDKTYNLQFLTKGNKIVVLGKSTATTLFREIYPEFPIKASLIHPSGKAKETYSIEWKEVWRSPFIRNNYLIRVCL